MISTTLHLGNSGILQECWYLLGLADYEALGIPVCPNGVGSHDPTFKTVAPKRNGVGLSVIVKTDEKSVHG